MGIFFIVSKCTHHKRDYVSRIKVEELLVAESANVTGDLGNVHHMADNETAAGMNH